MVLIEDDMTTISNFLEKEKYGEYEGERWSIFVKYDDGSESIQDFYLVNKTTGNWKHFRDWNSKKFPINYINYLEWENTHPDTRKKIGAEYSWMSYADKVGQIEAMADNSHWF